jgi:hypothetical protein
MRSRLLLSLLRRLPDRTGFELLLTRRPIEFAKTVAPRAAAVRASQRGDALRSLPAVCGAFLVSAAALSVGVTPEYQLDIDSLR